MDYYYALLENYEQLKQRKFKLSSRPLNEIEKGKKSGAVGQSIDPVGGEKRVKRDAEASQAAADRAAQEDDAILARYGSTGRPVVIFKGGAFVEDSKPAKQIIKSLGPAQATVQQKAAESGGSNNPGVIPYTKEDGEEDTIEVYMRDPKAGGKKKEDEDAAGEALSPEELAQQGEDLEKQAQVDANFGEVSKALSEFGFGDNEALLADIVENTRKSTDLTEEELLEFGEGVKEFITTAVKVQGDLAGQESHKYTTEVNDLINKYKITVNEDTGCIQFDKLSIGMCNTDNPVAEGLGAAVETLDDNQRKDIEELGEASTAAPIPVVRPSSEVPMAAENERGVAMENIDTYIPMVHDCVGLEGDELRKCAEKIQTSVVDAIEVRRKWEECMGLVRTPLEEGKDHNNLSQWVYGQVNPQEVPLGDKEKSKANKEGKKCKEDPAVGGMGVSFDEILKSFAVGQLALDDVVITGEGERAAAARVAFIKQQLQLTMGMSEDQANKFVDDIVESGDGVKALLLVVMANRGFTRAAWGYSEGKEGITPTKTIGAGQGQGEGASNNLGAKKDLVDLYCDGAHTKDALVKNIRENVLGDEFCKKNYTKKCGVEGKDDAEKDKNINDNIGNMIEERPNPDDETKKCHAVPREPKTHTSITESSTLGETSHSKRTSAMGYMCKRNEARGKSERAAKREGGWDGKDWDDRAAAAEEETDTTPAVEARKGAKWRDTAVRKVKNSMGVEVDGLSEQETKRLDKIGDYMNECGGDLASTVSKACDFHTKLEDRFDTIGQILDGTEVKGVKNSQDEIFRTWLANKRPQDLEKAKKRLEGAKRCIKAKQSAKGGEVPQENNEDCEHLGKIKSEIQNTYFAKQMDEYTSDKTGEVTGAGREYYRVQYMMTGGSDVEVLNEKRGLQQNMEQVGLRNAEIENNLSNARWFRSTDKRIGTTGATQLYGKSSGKGRRRKVKYEGDWDPKDAKLGGKGKQAVAREEPTSKQIKKGEPGSITGEQRRVSTVTIVGVTESGKPDHSNVRASINVEGNVQKVSTGKGSKDNPLYSTIYNKESASKMYGKPEAIAEDKSSSKKEDILTTLLRGQKELLEQLINQTT